MTTELESSRGGEACDGCPLGVERREFLLRSAAFAAVAALAALGSTPGPAFARTVRAIAPTGVAGSWRGYPLPASDSVAVDDANDVIIARYQGRCYAFSIKCPHRGARLEWRAGESRIFCPKHKARFLPDGAHDSGRGSRDLDRFDVRRQGGQLMVDLQAVRRADQDAAAWKEAFIAVA